jgi:hypothetical protein
VPEKRKEVQNPAGKCIPLRELWQGFNPLGVRDGVFVVFRGYMDESCDKGQKLFAFSCLMATGKDWSEMERSWKLHLTAKNKQLKKAGRPTISRYRATDCNGYFGEFSGWEPEEQIEFVKGLFSTFKRKGKRNGGVHAVGYDINIDELCEVFPEWCKDRLEAAYYVLTKFVMMTIGEDFTRMGKDVPAKLTLFHDRTANGKYDPTILRAFNEQILDKDFDYARYFTTIAPLAWQDCVALQPADLVAFEVLKDTQARLDARKRRKSYTALLDLEEFGIHTRSFTKEVLVLMRQEMEQRRPIEALGFNLKR